MAEENESGTGAAESQAQPVNEQSGQAQQVQQIEQVASSPADLLDGLVSPETLAKLKEAEVKKETPAANNNQNPNPEDTGSEGQNEGANKKVPEEKPKEVKKEDGKEEPKSVFGINKKKESKQSNIVIETPEQIIDTMKSKFGVDVKDIKDAPKFFEVAQKWREDSQKLSTVQKEAGDLKSLLEGLPVNIIDGIKAYYKKEDYMKAITNVPKFDFSQPIEKQDVKAIVNHYFPNEFTDDDFKEEVKSKTLIIAEKAAIDKFEAEKQKYNESLTRRHEDATKQLEAIKASVSSSVSSLKQDFPDTDEEAINTVSEVLEGGPEKVFEFFFNNDRTLKADAAKKLMLAMHGESEIKRMMDVAANVTESKINEELLTKGADRPNTVKRSTPEQLPEELRQQINEMNQLKKKTTF